MTVWPQAQVTSVPAALSATATDWPQGQGMWKSMGAPLGRIARTELEELDNYVKAGELLALLQSNARQSLKQQKPGSTRHG
jgi:hypothetical protein